MFTLLFFVSCTDSIKDTPLEFCDNSTTVLYNPQSSQLLSFPDDYWTVEDPESPTGIRVDLSAESAPWTLDLGDVFTPIVEDISTRSGFARLGAVVLRFSGGISTDLISPLESTTNDKIYWLDLSVEPPERIAFTSTLGDDQNQLILKPVKPLGSGARHAVIVTDSFQDEAGNCVAPSPIMKDLLLDKPRESYEMVSSRVSEAIAQSQIDKESISHVLTFTTHNDVQMFSEIAEEISDYEYTWEEASICDPDNDRYCQYSFLSNDYRTNGAIESTTPTQQWEILVHSWMPSNAVPPYPVIIYGHGLNTRAETAAAVADIVDPLGIAVFAIDALHHGQHPTAFEGSSLPALNFLGINLAEFAFDSRSLRGNFDQSNADRLQLIELLKQHPDVNNDGIIEINPDHIMYYGISLGGVMGSQLMANSTIQAGVLAEGGGNLPVFITDTSTVEVLDDLLEVLIGPPDVLNRLLPVFQTGVDASDPAVWATYVLENRLKDDVVPDVLFPVCVEDDTVPPATAKALAHGLNIPHLTPVLDTVPLLEIQEGPLHANLPSGSTAAYFQFDRITDGEDVVATTHDNLPNSPEAIWMIQHFLSTHLAGETEIKDPYAEMNTPPLQ